MTDNPGTFRSINYTLAANVTITLLGIATGIMTARLLGPTGEGQYAAIQTWPLLLSTAAQLGLPEALVFYLSKNIDKSREYVVTAQILAIVSSIIVFIVSWIILPFLLHSQGTSTVDAARIFMLISFIYSLIAIPHGALRGLQMFKVWNIFRIFPGVAWLLIVISFWAVKANNPILLSRIFLLTIFITGLFQLPIFYSKLKGKIKLQSRYISRLVKFGLPSVLTSIPQNVNIRLDQFFIIALLPPKFLGYYVVAVSWGNGVSPLLLSIGYVIFPKVSSSNSTDQIKLLKTSLQGAILIGIPIGLLLFVTAPIAIPLIFGNSFKSSVIPALVLVPAGSILAWAGVAEEGLRGLGKPNKVLVAEMYGATATLISLTTLLHYFGILGAAISSLIGYLTVALFCLRAIAKSTNMKVYHFIIPSKFTLVTIKNKIYSIFDKRKNQ